MAIIQNKPNMNYGVWGSNGNIAVPTSEKVDLGWIIEKPPNEVMNWLQNRQDSMLQFINQRGIPTWDSLTEYPLNAYVVRSGTLYRAVSQNIDKDPTLNSEIWNVAFATYTDYSNLYNEVQSIKGVEGYLDLYVSRNNPVMLGEAKGVGYKDSTGTSGLVFAGNTPKISVEDKVVASFKDLTNSDENSNAVATTEWVQDLIKSTMDAIVPIGSIIDYPSLVFNSELFLPCNGQEISRTIYQDLFSVIGTMYGVGNGSTTFNIPDYRGTFRRTADLGKGLDNGRAVGSYQSDAIRKITGWSSYGMDSDVSTVTDFKLQADGAFKMSEEVYYDGLNNLSWVNSPSANKWRRLELDTSRIVPTASENRPVNMAVQTLIRAK